MAKVQIVYYLFIELVLVVCKEIESIIPSSPPEKWKKGEKGDIILIQGFNETWIFLKQIGDFLNLEGYRVHTVSQLGRNLTSIDRAAALVKSYMEKHLLSDVKLVVHSKGGRIAKKLLADKTTAPKITKTIFIASPHKGTLFGHAHFFSLNELRPKVVEKEVDTLTPENVVNIYPLVDELVIPNSSLSLPGVKNVCIPVVGHLQILRVKQTFQEIKVNL